MTHGPISNRLCVFVVNRYLSTPERSSAAFSLFTGARDYVLSVLLTFVRPLREMILKYGVAYKL